MARDPFVWFMVFMRPSIRDRWDSGKAKILVSSSGRTKKWIAEEIGISAKTLTNILNGSSPSLQTVKLLAHALGLEEGVFLNKGKSS